VQEDQTPELQDAQENPLRTVWTLAWPAVALNALQTVNSLLDTNFVQHLEADALTAIGAATTTLFLLISLSMAVGVAATAMVSRAYGENDHAKYIEANKKCLGFAVIMGILLIGVAVPLSYPATRFVIPPDAPHAAALMVQYLTIVSAVLPAVFVIQTLAGSLRGIGDTKSPMVISGIQILLHIAFNFLLIFPNRTFNGITIPGANLGLAGAAWALVISAWISATIYLIFVTKTPLGESWRIKLPGWEWTKRIYRIAAPAGLMSIVRVTSLFMFFAILKYVPQGKSAIAAVRPGFSIEALAFMPSFGLAIAASALVGQSLGMKKPERAAALGWMAGHQAAIVSAVAAALIFAFAGPLANTLLADQPQIAALTANYLRYVASTEIFFGYGMVLISAMQGAGDTVRPFWISFICMWLIRVPLAAVLALETIPLGPITIPGFGMGANGCWLTLAITQLIQGVAAMIYWKLGHWKTAKV
jgi:putative MATE family efflux protein